MYPSDEQNKYCEMITIIKKKIIKWSRKKTTQCNGMYLNSKYLSNTLVFSSSYFGVSPFLKRFCDLFVNCCSCVNTSA